MYDSFTFDRLSLENVHSVEHVDFASALAAAEKDDEEHARLTDSSMDSKMKVSIAKILSVCGVNVELTRSMIDKSNAVFELADVL